MMLMSNNILCRQNKIEDLKKVFEVSIFNGRFTFLTSPGRYFQSENQYFESVVILIQYTIQSMIDGPDHHPRLLREPCSMAAFRLTQYTRRK